MFLNVEVDLASKNHLDHFQPQFSTPSYSESQNFKMDLIEKNQETILSTENFKKMLVLMERGAKKMKKLLINPPPQNVLEGFFKTFFWWILDLRKRSIT